MENLDQRVLQVCVFLLVNLYIIYIIFIHLGPPGPPGPPGDGLGYDAASLAALLAQGAVNNQKGPDAVGDEPARIFGGSMTEQERREFVIKAYEQLKTSFEKFKKPNGEKNNPAKTCKDIANAYPASKSGNFWYKL